MPDGSSSRKRTEWRFRVCASHIDALNGAGSAAVVLNAANEVAVARFVEGRLGFRAIPEAIERAMADHTPAEVVTLAQVRAVDAWARTYTEQLADGLESRA